MLTGVKQEKHNLRCLEYDLSFLFSKQSNHSIYIFSIKKNTHKG